MLLLLFISFYDLHFVFVFSCVDIVHFAVALHSHFLFDVIPHPSVDYVRVFMPIWYFQPNPSQSDLRHFYFRPFRYLLAAGAIGLSGHYLPIGVFYLTLTLLHWHFNLRLSTFPWEPVVLSWSLQGFILILESTDPTHGFVWFTVIHNLHIQTNSALNSTICYHELLVVKV